MKTVLKKMKQNYSMIQFSGGGGGLVVKSCMTLANSMDCSPAGSSVHGISQAKIPEWVTVSFSRGSS